MCSTDEPPAISEQSPSGCESGCCAGQPAVIEPPKGCSDGCCEGEETRGGEEKDDCCSGAGSVEKSDLKDAFTVAAQNCCDHCEESGAAGCDREYMKFHIGEKEMLTS